MNNNNVLLFSSNGTCKFPDCSTVAVIISEIVINMSETKDRDMAKIKYSRNNVETTSWVPVAWTKFLSKSVGDTFLN